MGLQQHLDRFFCRRGQGFEPFGLHPLELSSQLIEPLTLDWTPDY